MPEADITIDLLSYYRITGPTTEISGIDEVAQQPLIHHCRGVNISAIQEPSGETRWTCNRGSGCFNNCSLSSSQ